MFFKLLIMFKILFFCLICKQQVLAATDKVVCYHGTWSAYRPSKGTFNIENIDTSLCTHAVYAFVGITAEGSVNLFDVNLDLARNGFTRFNALKEKNPKLKTLIAIGGWTEASDRFTIVAANPQLRAKFIQEAISFAKTHKFDGFDLDWEYPGDRGGQPADKANFATLVEEMYTEFKKQQPPLLLSAAVKATQDGINLSYDVARLSKNLDMINIMAYDLHGYWDSRTGHNAPLYAHPSDTNNQLNVDACVNAWLKAGASPEKLILGMGTYGQTFTLSSQNDAIGSPTSGAGLPGPYTQQAGMMGYNEICEKLNLSEEGSWKVEFNEAQKVPIASKGNQWIGYDDPQSVAIKTQYAVEKNLGGAMIWSIETDDFNGVCGQNYPLLRAINDALSRPVPSTTSSPSSSSTTTSGPSSTTKRPNPGDEICTKEGFVRDPIDCNKFYYCFANLPPVEYKCPEGLYFDEKIGACNFPDQVDC